MSEHRFSHRLQQLQTNIPSQQAWLIAKPTDIQYLTGFVSLVPEEREALLLVTSQSAALFYAAFSPVTKLPTISYYPGVYAQKVGGHLQTIWQEQHFTNLLLDEAALFVNELRVIETFAKRNAVTLQPITRSPVETQRMYKEPSEIALLNQAGQVAAKAWAALEPLLVPGVTEFSMKQKLEQLLLEFGSQAPAFPTIIAFAEHTALPHHQPTNRVLNNNEAVLVDFGAIVDNYRSDCTRTVWVGQQPDPLYTTISSTVLAAYKNSFELLKSHASSPTTNNSNNRPLQAIDLDNAARSVIKAAGYEHEFIHTTGHSIGLDIHEQPSISWSNTTDIKPGMVITIEPGIYLPGKFGYRYENTVATTLDDALELTVLH